MKFSPPRRWLASGNLKSVHAVHNPGKDRSPSCPPITAASEMRPCLSASRERSPPNAISSGLIQMIDSLLKLILLLPMHLVPDLTLLWSEKTGDRSAQFCPLHCKLRPRAVHACRKR